MESTQDPGGDAQQPDFTDEPEVRQGPPTIFRRDEPANGKGGDASDDVGGGNGGTGDSIAQTLRNMAATLEADPPPAVEQEASALPMQPRNLAELGLSKAFLTDLVLKIMHYSGTPSTAQLMRRLGLGQNLVQQILTSLQEDRLCEVLSQSDLFTGNYRYRLSERGTARAAEALERTRYAGPAPVTAEQYADALRAQKEARRAPSPDHIKAILGEFVLTPEVADSAARALYSGKTTLFHGPSGNGKTSILERYAHCLTGATIVPYALYAYGQVIRIFDPSIHEPIEDIDEQNAVKDDGKLDRRWVLVRQPAVILGSQVGPESLDLAYDPQARFYQAPPHIKAQGGVLVIDDLGRQRADPRELMTRWLIAVDRGWDSLGLITGEKLAVPFDVQLLFGTNREVAKLADDALLRRILYKVEIKSPGPHEFAEILRHLAHQKNVSVPDGAIERVVERLFTEAHETPRAAYAGDLLEVLIEGAAYDGHDPVLDEESFERAFKLFMSQKSDGQPS